MTKTVMKKEMNHHQLMAKAIMDVLTVMHVVFGKSELESAFVESLVTGNATAKGKDTTLFVDAVWYLKKKGEVKVSRRTGDLELSRQACLAIPTDFGRGRTNDEMHRLIFGILVKQVENLYTLSELWTVLSDGSAHFVENLGNPDLYQHTEAKSLSQAKTAMKRLGLIEKVGNKAIRLTDKAFPEGRPVNAEEV